jgi:3-hydroxyisobutyrate dehydrogenase
MKVGYIGLGAMGAGMALNLRKAGHDVAVHDLRRESAEPHVAAGATWADSIEQLASSADVVFTSLPGPKEMQAVAFGKGGLFEAMRPGAVWFDVTTNSPTVVREVAARFAERDITLLDTPVSGGPSGARSGKLAIYIGGPHAVYERYKGVLEAIGDELVYVGEVGAGNSAKLVHNLASNSIRLLIAEVFTLGVKAGVDPAELWHAIRVGAIGRSRTFDRIGDQYLQAKYDPPSFTVRLAHKDLTLGLDLARELGVPMKFTQAAFEDFSEAIARGWADGDARLPMQLQNERAGVDMKLTADEVKRILERA